jgi:hypothetical protein
VQEGGFTEAQRAYWWPGAEISVSMPKVEAGTLVELKWQGARGYIKIVEPDGATGYIRVGYSTGNQLIKFYSVGTYTFHLVGDTKHQALMASAKLRVTKNIYLKAAPIEPNDELHEAPRPWRRRGRVMGRPRVNPLPFKYVGWRPTPSPEPYRSRTRSRD